MGSTILAGIYSMPFTVMTLEVGMPFISTQHMKG